MLIQLYFTSLILKKYLILLHLSMGISQCLKQHEVIHACEFEMPSLGAVGILYSSFRNGLTLHWDYTIYEIHVFVCVIKFVSLFQWDID